MNVLFALILLAICAIWLALAAAVMRMGSRAADTVARWISRRRK